MVFLGNSCPPTTTELDAHQCWAHVIVPFPSVHHCVKNCEKEVAKMNHGAICNVKLGKDCAPVTSKLVSSVSSCDFF